MQLPAMCVPDVIHSMLTHPSIGCPTGHRSHRERLNESAYADIGMRDIFVHLLQGLCKRLSATIGEYGVR